jgi:ribonuclease HII
MSDVSVLVAGIDEVGRGPLAGPVVAAVVVLNPDRPIKGLADSKALTPGEREYLADAIRLHALAWAIGRAEASEIDAINILQASLLAMQRAFSALTVAPALAMVDGIHAPRISCRTQTVIQGDVTVPSISAASILAKVARDAEMRESCKEHPGYGFAQHKGYPTLGHMNALERLGVCPIHRRSFEPVRRLLSR